LIKEDVKEKRRKDAPLQNAAFDFDNEASGRVGGVADSAGVSHQHPRYNPNGSF
jgi:hypothetical protein